MFRTYRTPCQRRAGARSLVSRLLAAATFLVAYVPCAHATTTTAENTQAVVDAANAFLALLTTSQKTAINSTSNVTNGGSNSSCQYNFLLANAEVWSNIPVAASTRNGLQFSALSSTQLAAALAVADAALSDSGTTLLEEIRLADKYISGEVTNSRGTTSSMWGYSKYYIAFVGTPSTTSPWTLQIGGHHMAYNITYNGTYTTGTPMFAGNEPNSFTISGVTYAPLGTPRSIIVSMRPTLTTSALLSGSYSDVVFGPNGTGSHDTVQPKAYPTSGRGQLYSSLTTTQQALVREYVTWWVNHMNESIAEPLLADYLSDAALAETYVGYAGSSTTLATSGSYFRVDGPRVWIEYIVQGGVYDSSGVHDHTVFRDKLADYGAAYGSTTIATTLTRPAITTQPASQSVATGSSATFSVGATGSDTLTYQWYKDSSAISGATSSSYAISSATTSIAGSYFVIVTNSAGVTTSSAATLTVTASASSAPTITTQPLAAAIATGDDVTFTVEATGSGTLTYQWYKDAVAVSGGTSATYSISSAATSDAGDYTVVVTDDDGSTTSDAAALLVTTATSIESNALINLSARAYIPAGGTLIAGFWVNSATGKSVLVRAVGPTLSYYDVSGYVEDTSLELFDTDGVSLASNGDWDSSLATTFETVGAAAWPEGSLDAALLTTFTDGGTTAHVTATTAGVALAEVFDADTPTTDSRLVNLSGRAYVGTGDNVLIAGFWIEGTGGKRLLIRAVGPKLTDYDVSGVLADPVLRIYDTSGRLVAANDDWDASLESTFTTVGAFSLDEGSKDAALLVTLPADAGYTAIVTGADDTTGEALVEVYEVP